MDAVEYLEEAHREALALRKYHIVFDMVDRLLGNNGVKLDKDSNEYYRLAHEMLKAQVELMKIERKQSYAIIHIKKALRALSPSVSRYDPVSQNGFSDNFSMYHD